MINQEYYLRDGNHYVPDEGFQDYGRTDVEILPKKDGSQGVSVYDNGSFSACVINGVIHYSPYQCYVNSSNYAVPVISIKGDAIISGTGTADNPFKVE